jgi:O-methyltransferase
MIKPQSLLPEGKLETLRILANRVKHLDGACAEVGVYKGGSAWEIVHSIEDKWLYLFDTFAGIPKKEAIDVHCVGDFKDTSFDEIVKIFEPYPKVLIYPGFFPLTATNIPEHEKFIFVHLDADQYTVTKESIDFFWPRMVPGGIIVLDDCDWPRCPGIRKSVDEFKGDKKFIKFTQYQGVFFK